MRSFESTKLLKLACLYELFRLPDCAAELVVAHRERLKPLIDPDLLLNLLTPKLDDVERSYDGYLKLLAADPEAFFQRRELLQSERGGVLTNISSANRDDH